MSEGLIDIGAVFRLRNFTFRVPSRFKGVRVGIHKSLHRGVSPDFLEYKEYSQGDDIRHIDWRLYARLDRLYVKKYEDEVSINWCLLIDRSGSMGYGSSDECKLEFARRLAATLAYLLIKQGDSVGVADFADDEMDFLTPRFGTPALTPIIEKLKSLSPSGDTNFRDPIQKIIDRTNANTVFFLISDFLTDLPSIEETLKLIRSSRKGVITLHVLDKEEIDFNFYGSIEFEGMEEKRKILVDAKSIRKSYRKKIEEFIKNLELICHQNNSKYLLSPTHYPIEDVLIQIATK